jgi:hypothetical protein
VVVNKLKYFICELDLFFNRRGAEGTEEEKKEINLKSPIPNLKLIPVRKKNATVGNIQTMIVIRSQSKISNLKSKMV